MSFVWPKSTLGLRSTSAWSGTAARSSARTSFSEPLTARPIGVRTASTMTASDMSDSFDEAPASHSRSGFPRRRTRRGLPHRIGNGPLRRRAAPPGAPQFRVMKVRLLLLLACALVAAAVAADGALADALQFAAPTLLPHGDPKKPDYLSGGEPSIAFDPAGDGHLYVTAPQFIPTGVNGACNQAGVGCSPTNSQTGVGYWASDDHGATWPRSGNTGVPNGGGDSDVVVLPEHSVLAADLAAADTAICISSDFAKSFDNCANGLTTNQQGPENDREWLTPAGGKTVYLTYHDFAAGFPIIERSDNGGTSFSPCGTVIDPGGPAAQTYTPQRGTLVSKPVVRKDGTAYVEFTTPAQPAPPVA